MSEAVRTHEAHEQQGSVVLRAMGWVASRFTGVDVGPVGRATEALPVYFDRVDRRLPLAE